jgi:hypothetical protein
VENDDPSLQEPLSEPEAGPVREPRRKAAKPRSSDEDGQGELF